LALYPVETTGGMLQQASLWPWLAGIVDILAIVGATGLLVPDMFWYDLWELMFGWTSSRMLDNRRA
jgi:hypothetical protein